MGKTKPAGPSVDELVNAALLRVATAEGPLRLSGKGDHPPLFKSTAGPAKVALDQRLLEIVGDTKKAESVRLTAAGLVRIASALPEARVGVVAKRVVVTLPADEQVTFLQDFLPKVPTAAPELEPVLAEAVRRQAEESEARVVAERARAERAEASRVALERCLNHLTQLRTGRVEELKKLLLAAGGTVPETPVSPPPPVPEAHRQVKQPEPGSAEDRDFRRDVAERLVSSWRDAVNMKKEEARRFLETALDNISGLRRVGEEGEQIPFDGALHENIPGVFTDHPVTVTRSGWALEDGEDREYVIQKAQVAK